MPGACAGGSDRPSRQGEQSVEPMWTGLSVRRLAFMLLEAGVKVLKLAGYSGTSHVAHEVDEDGGHEGRTRTHPPIIRPEASHQPTPATLRAHHMRDSGTEAGAGRLLVSAGCFLGWQRARSSMITKLGVTLSLAVLFASPCSAQNAADQRFLKWPVPQQTRPP
jgi:hypothetical protein